MQKLNLLSLEKFSRFLSSADFFQNQLFEKFFQEYRVSNSLDPDQAQHFVGPDLSTNCLQKLSADDTRRYEGCSNMNASSFITSFTYMLRQHGKRFCKGLYVTFELAPDLKKNSVYRSSYSPLNKGHVSILTLNALNIYQ